MRGSVPNGIYKHTLRGSTLELFDTFNQLENHWNWKWYTWLELKWYTYTQGIHLSKRPWSAFQGNDGKISFFVVCGRPAKSELPRIDRSCWPGFTRTSTQKLTHWIKTFDGQCAILGSWFHYFMTGNNSFRIGSSVTRPKEWLQYVPEMGKGPAHFLVSQ